MPAIHQEYLLIVDRFMANHLRSESGRYIALVQTCRGVAPGIAPGGDPADASWMPFRPVGGFQTGLSAAAGARVSGPRSSRGDGLSFADLHATHFAPSLRALRY